MSGTVGTIRVKWDDEKINRSIDKAAGAALDDAGEFLLEEANKTVPIEEGILQDSGTVDTDRARLVTAVSYDTKYARRQHEDTRLRHDPGRRAKWLELTLREQRSRILKHIQTRLKRGFS